VKSTGHSPVRMGRATLLLLLLLAAVICLIPLTGCIPNLNPNSTSKATTAKTEKASIGTIYDHVLSLENELKSTKTEDAMREKNMMAEIELIKSRLQAIEAKLK
jgi:hypothetical protein